MISLLRTGDCTADTATTTTATATTTTPPF
ncbi:hypothetical protein GMORB2_5994 [Geosmithia morbida]|uniref:Uncharacterized protein n=1 Tax=Geosmithia morbida TaxID=1094350 RepID=A0A9P5D1T3_9HYPO|nr:uncharacterized protein GMORB2_5994 [Geosmithia morbida]KAF4124278.1 hypothetical protein GMORB2_5994 [Geosmithia morbida]